MKNTKVVLNILSLNTQRNYCRLFRIPKLTFDALFTLFKGNDPGCRPIALDRKPFPRYIPMRGDQGLSEWQEGQECQHVFFHSSARAGTNSIVITALNYPEPDDVSVYNDVKSIVGTVLRLIAS